MDTINAIRSGIFLVAGLAALLFPEKIQKMQIYILKKMLISCQDNIRSLKTIGIIFLIISVALFIYSIMN